MIVFLFVLVCFVCLIIRLVQINIADGDTYEKNVLTLLNYDGQTIPYKRGDITDRNGTVLATSEKIYNLVLDPYVITQSTDEKASEYVAEVLEEYFSIDQATVKKTLEEQPNSRYVVLRRKMTYDEKSHMMIFYLRRTRTIRKSSVRFHPVSGSKKVIRECILFPHLRVI